ncbi:hypothetical protein FOA52_008870 [Chlamydomonas sp. UWO 241]|nr:hypothetical protein FOA52_008870 [Chlamydomonas sp. UWO 241]
MQRLLGCLLPSRRSSNDTHHEERPVTTAPPLHSGTPCGSTASDGSSRILCHIVVYMSVPSHPPPGCFLRVDTACGGPLCWIQPVGAGAMARAALSGGGDNGKPSARSSLDSVSLALRDLCSGDGSVPSSSSSSTAAAGTVVVMTSNGGVSAGMEHGMRAATHAHGLADCLADVAAWVLCGPRGDGADGADLGAGVPPAAPPVRTWVVPPGTGAVGGSGSSGSSGSSGQALLPPGSSIDVAVVYMATAGEAECMPLRAALLLTMHAPQSGATPAAATPASLAGQLSQTSTDPCEHSAPRKAVHDRALIPAGGTPLCSNNRPAAATATATGSAEDSDRLAMMVQGMPCIVTLLELQPSDSCASNGGQGSTSALSLGKVLTQNDASVRHWGAWRGRDAAPLMHRLFGARGGSVGGGGGGADETALADLRAHLAACMEARGAEGEHAHTAAALWRRVLTVPSARACAVLGAAGTDAGVGATAAAATAQLHGPLHQLVKQCGGGGGDDSAALRAALIVRDHSADASLVPLLASTPEASTLEEEQLEGRLLSLQARLTAAGGMASAAKQLCTPSLQLPGPAILPSHLKLHQLVVQGGPSSGPVPVPRFTLPTPATSPSRSPRWSGSLHSTHGGRTSIEGWVKGGTLSTHAYLATAPGPRVLSMLQHLDSQPLPRRHKSNDSPGRLSHKASKQFGQGQGPPARSGHSLDSADNSNGLRSLPLGPHEGHSAAFAALKRGYNGNTGPPLIAASARGGSSCGRASVAHQRGGGVGGAPALRRMGSSGGGLLLLSVQSTNLEAMLASGGLEACEPSTPVSQSNVFSTVAEDASAHGGAEGGQNVGGAQVRCEVKEDGAMVCDPSDINSGGCNCDGLCPPWTQFRSQDIKDGVEGDNEEAERMLRREDVDAKSGEEEGVEAEEDEEEEEEADEEEHEVTAMLVTDPVTGCLACLITQEDVSARAHVERQMAALTGAQLAMLESVFPRHVLEYVVTRHTQCSGNTSNAMCATEMSALATQHDEVSILFMDIVGFTSMAKEVPAHQVMEFLQELFSVFDSLCDQYNVYKVETAGDCYIVAGSLMCRDESGCLAIDPRPDARAGAGAVLAFAKAMLAHARRVVMPHNGQPTTVRIGVHTGACVSGLIGTRQPKFALFGDTMNTSSRMESTATPGCIQVSEVTYALLSPPDARLFRATNGIEVKGKGRMDTYLFEPSEADMDNMGRELVAAEEAQMEAQQQVARPAHHEAPLPGADHKWQTRAWTMDMSDMMDRVSQLLVSRNALSADGVLVGGLNAAAAAAASPSRGTTAGGTAGGTASASMQALRRAGSNPQMQECLSPLLRVRHSFDTRTVAR